MNPRVILNEADHAGALRRIEELTDAEAGTAKGDELDVWITLVDGKRALTVNMIRALNGHLGIPLQSLVGTAGRDQVVELPEHGNAVR